jgi:hypothetical protein
MIIGRAGALADTSGTSSVAAVVDAVGAGMYIGH